jgi:DNA-binding response OmpR family regulator
MSTILLVEDEAQQRDVLAMMFESEGYTVTGVSSAEEALSHLGTTVPHLVITDVKLGGMDGISMFEQSRREPRLAGVPFIFITGYNDPEAIERVTMLGSADYITKPYELETLLARVRKQCPPGGADPTGRA